MTKWVPEKVLVQRYILRIWNEIKFVYSEKATKFCEISPLLLSTVHTDKSKVEISQNFVAFSKSMNFNANVTYHVGNSTIAVILLNSYVSRENFDGKNFMKKGWVRQKMHLCFLWWLNANSTESLAEIGFFFKTNPLQQLKRALKLLWSTVQILNKQTF